MKIEVIVKFKGNVDKFGVRLDDKQLQFNDQGQATLKVEEGSHFLNYFVIAPPGTKFTTSITAPESAKWEREQKVPADGIVVGAKKFEVK